MAGSCCWAQRGLPAAAKASAVQRARAQAASRRAGMRCCPAAWALLARAPLVLQWALLPGRSPRLRTNSHSACNRQCSKHTQQAYHMAGMQGHQQTRCPCAGHSLAPARGGVLAWACAWACWQHSAWLSPSASSTSSAHVLAGREAMPPWSRVVASSSRGGETSQGATGQSPCPAGQGHTHVAM